jgi:ADP-ribose pyrophosphatase YjhB (NUDIX family)
VAQRPIKCPHCGQEFPIYDNPKPVADVIIEYGGGIILIRRKNPPFGWAIPGGFLDYGETVEAAAIREAREETGLELADLRQFHVYSDPRRDARVHTISTVFFATGLGTPCAGDDAADVGVFTPDRLPSDIAFDHAQILADYFAQRGSRS